MMNKQTFFSKISTGVHATLDYHNIVEYITYYHYQQVRYIYVLHQFSAWISASAWLYKHPWITSKMSKAYQ